MLTKDSAPGPDGIP